MTIDHVIFVLMIYFLETWIIFIALEIIWSHNWFIFSILPERVTGIDVDKVVIEVPPIFAFKESIISLLNTNFDGPIFLIDDCSNNEEHLNFVKDLDKDKRITIYIKKERAGISKIKNTSIRLLLESDVDILFLADDDVYYLIINQ